MTIYYPITSTKSSCPFLGLYFWLTCILFQARYVVLQINLSDRWPVLIELLKTNKQILSIEEKKKQFIIIDFKLSFNSKRNPNNSNEIELKKHKNNTTFMHYHKKLSSSALLLIDWNLSTFIHCQNSPSAFFFFQRNWMNLFFFLFFLHFFLRLETKTWRK